MILGIIPARGGSKGIPRKNIKMIAGKPLIAWSIEAAKQSKLIDRFVVSTEDKEIAEISRKFEAEVLERPMELASDTASSVAVLQHVLEVIPADTVVLLEPTSPVRDPGIIDTSIKRFRETGVDSLATGFICKFMEYGTYTQRRQDLNGFFYNDGTVYVIKSSVIKGGRTVGDVVEKLQVDREQNVEIDDDFDFWLAEQILLKRIKEGRI